MEMLSNYSYGSYNTPEVKQIRIPQQEWADGIPKLGATGLPVASGIVQFFDFDTGNGAIATDTGEEVFFNFTAIPGEGYRTIKPGTPVKFEVVESKFGLTARNIQQ